MLRGTCYYSKKIKVENVAESAKIVTNVQTFRDCALTFVSGLCPDICYDFGTFRNILNFYFLTDSQTVQVSLGEGRECVTASDLDRLRIRLPFQRKLNFCN